MKDDIKKIFEEVSAERTDYLKEVFSDNMKMVNSKDVIFNKEEFIVRLHIGLEDPKDLINDLKKGLKKIK